MVDNKQRATCETKVTTPDLMKTLLQSQVEQLFQASGQFDNLYQCALSVFTLAYWHSEEFGDGGQKKLGST